MTDNVCGEDTCTPGPVGYTCGEIAKARKPSKAMIQVHLLWQSVFKVGERLISTSCRGTRSSDPTEGAATLPGDALDQTMGPRILNVAKAKGILLFFVGRLAVDDLYKRNFERRVTLDTVDVHHGGRKGLNARATKCPIGLILSLLFISNPGKRSPLKTASSKWYLKAWLIFPILLSVPTHAAEGGDTWIPSGGVDSPPLGVG